MPEEHRAWALVSKEQPGLTRHLGLWRDDMSIQPIIFLGPSLPVIEASEILDADYREPLQSGDLDAIGGRALIGLIDGLLEPGQRPEITEVRRALDRGSRIFGAASTGALLASQVDQGGMQGLGRVYRLLSRFPDHAEDLIAVLFTLPDHRKLTVPLVNVVLTCIDLYGEDDMAQFEIGELIQYLRSIPLSHRTPRIVRNMLEKRFKFDESIMRGVRIKDYKAEDARSLLHNISRNNI